MWTEFHNAPCKEVGLRCCVSYEAELSELYDVMAVGRIPWKTKLNKTRLEGRLEMSKGGVKRAVPCMG